MKKKPKPLLGIDEESWMRMLNLKSDEIRTLRKSVDVLMPMVSQKELCDALAELYDFRNKKTFREVAEKFAKTQKEAENGNNKR